MRRLGLYFLELERMRGDVSKTYKNLHELDRLNARRILPLTEESWTKEAPFEN